MARKYSLVIEGDASGYSVYVPELPAILVAGETIEALTQRATEAILLCLEECAPPMPTA
jgi:predicted RNase H-like HicB family nuclease